MVDSSIVAKYSFFCWKTHCSLAGNGGCSRLVVVFLLGSSPTVETENQAKLLQPAPLDSAAAVIFSSSSKRKQTFALIFFSPANLAVLANLCKNKTQVNFGFKMHY